MKTIDDYLHQIHENSKTMEVMPTGFGYFDNFLSGGFMRKELVILGGRTGSGKSYVAGQIAWNIASAGFKVGIFSLEISGEMVVSRLVGSLCNIHPTLLVMGKIKPEEQEKIEDAEIKVSILSNLITIYDDLYDFNNIAKQISDNKFDFVVIDFIQNIITKGDEYERMSKVSLDLQRTAKINNCCIMALSQLSNSAVDDEDKIEYKGSGGIAMVADLGLFIKRDKSDHTQLSIQIRKNRRGFSGEEFKLKFQSPGGKIYE